MSDHGAVEYWTGIDPVRWQRVGRLLTRRIGKLICGYRAFGSDQVPAEGPFIIAPNHASYLDALFFAHGFNRTLRFMAKYQALEWPIVGRMIRRCGGFPVRRGVDGQPALAIARAILESGDGLMMFMEGKLVRDRPQLGEPRRGLALLALQTGAPVVPVAAWGTKPPHAFGRRRKWWRRRRTTVVWGRPITFERIEEPAAEQVEQARDRIWRQVEHLFEVAGTVHRMHPRPATYEVPPLAEPAGARDQTALAPDEPARP